MKIPLSNTRVLFLGAALVLGLLSSSPVQAVPLLLNFQGRVTVDGAVFNGTGQFKFALVNADGTQSYWSNDGSSSAGSQPTAAVTVPVVNGNYSLHLGDTNMDALQASVFANDPIFLRIWFSDGTPNGFERLGTVDHRITSVAFALKAKEAETVSTLPDGLVTEAHLATALKDKLDALQAKITTLETAIALNTAKTGITTAQMDAIAVNAVSIGTNATAISTETARAQAAEAVNAVAISDESTRAQAAETTNATAISAEAVTARAAEAVNAVAISDESTRAQAAETTNATA
ncbi:MAG: hypothetical protein HON54_04095, partial [Verrucomicrobia bacterium]|nr:hypothetical protein [Verrucomicrobiota bacterium]